MYVMDVQIMLNDISGSWPKLEHDFASFTDVGLICSTSHRVPPNHLDQPQSL